MMRIDTTYVMSVNRASEAYLDNMDAFQLASAQKTGEMNSSGILLMAVVPSTGEDSRENTASKGDGNDLEVFKSLIATVYF